MVNKVLVIEPLDEEEVNNISTEWRNKNYQIDYEPNISESELIQSIEKYRAIIVGSHNISRELIEKWRAKVPFDKLAIVRAGSNTSTIDKKAASEHEIIVMNTFGVNSQAVSEYIIKRMLDFFHHNQHDRAKQDIKNNLIKPRDVYYHNYLYNKKLALIGTGQIGSKVAKAARALGVKVQGYSPNFNPQKAKELDIEYHSTLESALKNADVISIQVPYVSGGISNATIKMIDENKIQLLNNGAFIINVSRLDVIDINPLVEALGCGKVAGIAIDTMPSEINALISSHPSLVKNENVYITPSIATASIELKKDLTYQTLMRIFWYFENDKIVDAVK